jgi:hypothetical protein
LFGQYILGNHHHRIPISFEWFWIKISQYNGFETYTWASLFRLS